MRSNVLNQMRRSQAQLCKAAKNTLSSIPTYINNCDEEDCVLTSNLARINSLETYAAKLYKLSKKAFRLYTNCPVGDGVCRRGSVQCRQSARENQRIKRAEEKAIQQLYSSTSANVKTIPSSTYDCD